MHPSSPLFPHPLGALPDDLAPDPRPRLRRTLGSGLAWILTVVFWLLALLVLTGAWLTGA